MAEKSTARKAADAVDKWNKLEALIPDARHNAAELAENSIRARMDRVMNELDEDSRAAAKKLLLPFEDK